MSLHLNFISILIFRYGFWLENMNVQSKHPLFSNLFAVVMDAGGRAGSFHLYMVVLVYPSK